MNIEDSWIKNFKHQDKQNNNEIYDYTATATAMILLNSVS